MIQNEHQITTTVLVYHTKRDMWLKRSVTGGWGWVDNPDVNCTLNVFHPSLPIPKEPSKMELGLAIGGVLRHLFKREILPEEDIDFLMIVPGEDDNDRITVNFKRAYHYHEL